MKLIYSDIFIECSVFDEHVWTINIKYHFGLICGGHSQRFRFLEFKLGLLCLQDFSRSTNSFQPATGLSNELTHGHPAF